MKRTVIAARIVGAGALVVGSATLGCEPPEAMARERALHALQAYLDALGRGDKAAACKLVWLGEHDAAKCDKVERTLVDNAPSLPGSKLRVESASAHAHGASVDVVILTGSAGRVPKLRIDMASSCSNLRLQPAPSCPFWMMGINTVQ